MLERMIHELLARETGQPLLALSSLNNLIWFDFDYKPVGDHLGLPVGLIAQQVEHWWSICVINTHLWKITLLFISRFVFASTSFGRSVKIFRRRRDNTLKLSQVKFVLVSSPNSRNMLRLLSFCCLKKDNEDIITVDYSSRSIPVDNQTPWRVLKRNFLS